MKFIKRIILVAIVSFLAGFLKDINIDISNMIYIAVGYINCLILNGII